MRILIVGGTRFVGRHLTEAALSAGNDVSLLHRGKTGADLFPEATHLLADRNDDLSVLHGTSWDAVIDVSAYLPRQVTSLGEALGDNVGRYVFISSVSVYEAPDGPNYDEHSPTRTLPPGQAPDTVNDETYGALKVLCERAATEHFGQSALIIRPTYVIGPFDHSGRFTYWVQRLARGGNVLAPGYPDRAIQVIDARDLATFTLSPLSGTFHAVSPTMPFGQLLAEIAIAVAPPGTTLTWVDPQFLLDAGETGESIPLWYAGDEGDAMVNTADPAAAIGAGLVIRPLAESIHDIQREAPVAGFLSPDREAQLLAQWSTRRTD